MIHFNLGNFYGEVIAYEKDGKYYMGLDNYDRMAQIDISETFYREIEREFFKWNDYFI